MTNGLDDQRALEHILRIREVDAEMEGRIRVFTGIEVDILADGALDLDDEVLAQMEIVIASVHTRFDQSREEMTARILRAIENPYVRILGHPTGRLLLRREPFALDLGLILAPRRGAGRSRRAQRRPRAARPQRPRPPPGQRTRLQNRHQHRLPRRPQPGQDGLRHPPAPPRLARAAGCAEHPGPRSLPRRLAAPAMIWPESHPRRHERLGTPPLLRAKFVFRLVQSVIR